MLSPVVVAIRTCERPAALQPRRTVDWDATSRTLDEFPCASSLSCCSSFFAGSSSRKGSDEPFVAPACAAVPTRSAVEPPRPCPAPPASPPNACPLRGGVRVNAARRGGTATAPARRTCHARRERSRGSHARATSAARHPGFPQRCAAVGPSRASVGWHRRARRAQPRACSTSANIARNSGSKPRSTTVQCAPDPPNPPLEERCIARSRRKRQESVQTPQLKRAHGGSCHVACASVRCPRTKHEPGGSARALLASCAKASCQDARQGGWTAPRFEVFPPAR